MADLVKKIKIKKQDGTFTDYIPIGAEAKNVSTEDGESVQEKINNIVYKRDIIDNLVTNDNSKVLSAKQGKTLNDNFEESLKSNYYDEINYKQIRRYNTDCYVTIIPKYDNNSNLIPIYVDKDTVNSPNKYAITNKTTLTINGGLTKKNSQGQWKQSIVIGNGEILNGPAQDVSIWDCNLYIGFNENRELLEFKADEITAEQMIQSGVKNGYMVFYRFLNNGELEEHTDAPNWNVKAPRMDIGIKSNGDIVILATDGRTINNEGLDDEQALAVLLEYDCVKGFRTDGGGSTSLNIKGIKINRNIDDNGTTDRFIDTTLNVKKEIVNDEVSKVYDEISKQKQQLNKQIRDDFNNNISSIYLEVEHASRNNIETANTYQLAKFNGKYRHNDSIRTLTDENNNIIGFTVKRPGLVRVMFQANFESNAPGDKIIKITKGNTDTLERFTRVDVSESTTVTKQIIAETVINNPNEEDLPIKLWIRSNHAGDRFVRMSAYAEYLGSAES